MALTAKQYRVITSKQCHKLIKEIMQKITKMADVIGKMHYQ